MDPAAFNYKELIRQEKSGEETTSPLPIFPEGGGRLYTG